MDLGMMSRSNIHALIGEFFEQLFSRTQPGKLNPDVLVGHTTGEFNQLTGQIQNFDGFAHIQQEYLATLALGGALENQSDGLRNGHEVTHHVRVCDFDWAAGGNLFGEDWNDTAR